MTVQKNAPAAGGHQREGEDQNTHEGEPIMNQTTASPEYDARDVAEALEIIGDDKSSLVEFAPMDGLFMEPAPSITIPASQLGATDSAGATVMVRFVDRNGYEVPLDRDYLDEHIQQVSVSNRTLWQRTPNVAIRLGELLAISCGHYLVYRELEENGVQMLELVTGLEFQQRMRAEEVAWEQEHQAEIKAAMPEGANTYEVWDYQRGDVGIMYTHEIGPVTVSWPAHHRDGRIEVYERPDVMVQVGKMSDTVDGVEGIRDLAAALMAAIPLVEAVPA